MAVATSLMGQMTGNRMRVLVTGATGFIGSALLSRLRAQGDDVVAVGRDLEEARRRFPDAQWIALDLARAGSKSDWLAHLDRIDAVVNCAGALQDGLHDSTKGVHVTGVQALYAACEEKGVRRVVHISAIGVERAQPTEF